MKEDIQKLLREAYQLPYGFAQADLIKEAVRLADVSQDKELQFVTRERYLSATSFSGMDAELIVTFTWLLNHIEEYTDNHEYNLLWPYKWVLASVIDLPDFSTEQVEYFLNDAKSRYQTFNNVETRVLDLKEVYYHIQRGDAETAEKVLKQGESTPRDFLSDCIACDPAGRAENWYNLGNEAEAIKLYEELLASRKTCAEEPLLTHCRASLFYASVGRWEDALVAHQKGYPKLAKNDHLSVKAHFSLAYKLLANRNSDALKIFDTHLKTHLRTRDRWSAFKFYLAAWHMAQRLIEKGKSEVKLKSATKLPFHETPDSNTVKTEELATWLRSECQIIADRFDQRNNSTHFHDLMAMDWPFAPGCG